MFSKPQMSDLPAEKQAAKAIRHTLMNISERPGVAWYLGHGTQTYALLTEAYATLLGHTIEFTQENWPPAAPREVAPDSLGECPFCGSSFLEVSEDTFDTWVECKDCKARGPETSDFSCDDGETLHQAARRKWLKRQMPR